MVLRIPAGKLAVHSVDKGEEKKVKIVRAIARLNVGGPAIHVLNLTREMNNSEFETLLVHGKISDDEIEMTGFRGMDVENRLLLPELGRELHPVKDILTMFKMVGIIRRERPRILHTHTAKAGAVGRFAGALCGVPVIIHTYHGHVFHGYFSPAKTLFFKLVEKFLARFTTKIITLSATQKEEIRGILGIPENKLDVIPLGFDLDRFDGCRGRHAGEFREAIGVSEDTKVVAIIGRITAIKNHALFLETARRVAEKRDDVVFAVVGGGEDRRKCEELAGRLGIADRVVFAGWWEAIEKVYAGIDVTALTSDNEGTPVCLIESLSAGVPVVATDVGGVADVVRDGETGFLAPPGDAAALAAGVEKLLGDPALCEKMGAAGKGEMFARFSEKRLVDDMVGLYRSLLRSV